MAERRANLMEPRIEPLMSKVDSKFTLVTRPMRSPKSESSASMPLSIAALNDYYAGHASVDTAQRPKRLCIELLKPLAIAMEEVAADKITYERIEPGADDEAADDVVVEIAADDSPGDTPA